MIFFLTTDFPKFNASNILVIHNLTKVLPQGISSRLFLTLLLFFSKYLLLHYFYNGDKFIDFSYLFNTSNKVILPYIKVIRNELKKCRSWLKYHKTLTEMIKKYESLRQYISIFRKKETIPSDMSWIKIQLYSWGV